jgi:hypothetical protein
MLPRLMVVRLLTLTILVARLWTIAGSDERGLQAAAQDKKDVKEEKKGKKRGGTVVGTLTRKGENFIEVKADGEEKARKYVPHWIGGAPAQGGGPDKKMLAVFSKLKVGSRVEVKWEFEERLRAVAVKVLHEPPGAKKEGATGKEVRRGKSVGTLTKKGENFIELRGDGEEKARKYYARYITEPKPGFDPQVLQTFRKLTVGSRLLLEWVSTNHGPQVHRVEVLKRADQKN